MRVGGAEQLEHLARERTGPLRGQVVASGASFSTDEGRYSTPLTGTPGAKSLVFVLFPTFADFSAAFAFMTRVALAAEKRDHHPEWSNVWNQVSVDLVTHESKGITERDVAFALVVSELAG